MELNRMSKIVVMETLKKYLDNQLAWKIYEDIEKADQHDFENQVGMKYGEWKNKFDYENFDIVWAADSHGGFGKKGWTVYGNCDDLTIVRIDRRMDKLTLHLWDTDLWGWDDLKGQI